MGITGFVGLSILFYCFSLLRINFVSTSNSVEIPICEENG